MQSTRMEKAILYYIISLFSSCHIKTAFWTVNLPNQDLTHQARLEKYVDVLVSESVMFLVFVQINK